MFSSACSTWPSRIVTRSAPSPSTRASPATVSSLLRWLIVVPVGEGGSGGVERREHPADGALVHAAYPELLGQRGDVGGGHRAEASVAAARMSGAQRAAPGVGDGSQAGGPVRHHHARQAAALALGAHAGIGDVRLAP